MFIKEGSWQAEVIGYLENPKFREMLISFNPGSITVEVLATEDLLYNNNKKGIGIVELTYPMEMSVIRNKVTVGD